MSGPHLPEAAHLGTVRGETVTLASGPVPATGTTSAGQLTALELLSAWGAVPGPDLGDPRSVFERRRLAVRGTRVNRSARTARRAAACCPSATARASDAEPRESSGAIAAWSANAPPAPLSA
jgi:hypothetical protein